MPTQWKRVAVSRDPELDEALEKVARFYPDTAPARLVHDLAIRGADAVAREETERDEAIEQLVALSTGELDLFDREVLEHIDELAWGE